jgi:hypothetical protein
MGWGGEVAERGLTNREALGICWRVGELASWRVGELASWRVGELASWRVGGFAKSGGLRFVVSRTAVSPARENALVRGRSFLHVVDYQDWVGALGLF